LNKILGILAAQGAAKLGAVKVEIRKSLAEDTCFLSST